MTVKFVVYNPVSGMPSLYDTKDEALTAFWNIVVGYIYQYMGKTAYTRVEISEDGSETYFNDQEDEINFHMTVPQIEEMIAKYTQFINNPPTSE